MTETAEKPPAKKPHDVPSKPDTTETPIQACVKQQDLSSQRTALSAEDVRKSQTCTALLANVTIHEKGSTSEYGANGQLQSQETAKGKIQFGKWQDGAPHQLTINGKSYASEDGVTFRTEGDTGPGKVLSRKDGVYSIADARPGAHPQDAALPADPKKVDTAFGDVTGFMHRDRNMIGYRSSPEVGKIESSLGPLNASETQKFLEQYQKTHGVSFLDDLKGRLGDGKDFRTVEAMVNRRDGKTNDEGNAMIALQTMKEDPASGARLLRSTVGSLRSDQYAEMEKRFGETYKNDDGTPMKFGDAVKKALDNNPYMSPEERAINLKFVTDFAKKGVEVGGRTADDIKGMAAAITEVYGNSRVPWSEEAVKMLCDTVGGDTPAAQQARSALQQDQQFQANFNKTLGPDSNVDPTLKSIASDFLKEGHISLKTIVEGDKNVWLGFNDNNANIDLAIQKASPEERADYLLGHQLTQLADPAFRQQVGEWLKHNGTPAEQKQFADLSERLSKNPPELTPAEQAAKNYHDGLYSTFGKNGTAREQSIWDDQMVNGNKTLISQLAETHTDRSFSSWLSHPLNSYFQHSVNDLMTKTENVSKADYEGILANPQKYTDWRKQLETSMSTYATPEEQKRVLELVDRKHDAAMKGVSYEDSKGIKRSLNETMTDIENDGTLKTSIPERVKAVANSLPTMSQAEVDDYLKGGDFKKRLDSFVAQSGDAASVLATSLLKQVEQTKKPPQLTDVDKLLKEDMDGTKVEPLTRLLELNKIFKDHPDLRDHLKELAGKPDDGLRSQQDKSLLLAFQNAAILGRTAEDGKAALNYLLDGHMPTNMALMGTGQSQHLYLKDQYADIAGLTPEQQSTWRTFMTPEQRKILDEVQKKSGQPDLIDKLYSYSIGDGGDIKDFRGDFAKLDAKAKADLVRDFRDRYGVNLEDVLKSRAGTRYETEIEQVTRTDGDGRQTGFRIAQSLDGHLSAVPDGSGVEARRAADEYTAKLDKYNSVFETLPKEARDDLTQYLSTALQQNSDAQKQAIETAVNTGLLVATLPYGASVNAIRATVQAGLTRFAAKEIVQAGAAEVAAKGVVQEAATVTEKGVTTALQGGAKPVLESGAAQLPTGLADVATQPTDAAFKESVKKAASQLENGKDLDPLTPPDVGAKAKADFDAKVSNAEAQMEQGKWTPNSSGPGVEKEARAGFDRKVEETTKALYKTGALPEGTLPGVGEAVMRNEVGNAFQTLKGGGELDASVPPVIREPAQARFDRAVENAYKTLEGNGTLQETVGDGVKKAAEARMKTAVNEARAVLEKNGTLGPHVPEGISTRAISEFNQEVSGVEAKMEAGTWRTGTGSPGAETKAQTIFEEKVRLAKDALIRDGALPANTSKGVGDTVMNREVGNAYETLKSGQKLDGLVPDVVREQADALFKADVNNAYKVLEADGTVDAKAVGEGVASQAEARLKGAVSQARKTLEEGGKLDENVKPGVARRATEGFDQKVEETAARMEEPGYVPGSSAPGVERDARAIYDRKVKETTEAFYKDGAFPSTTSKGIEQAVMRNEVDNAFETLKAGKTVDGAVPQVVRDVAQERFDRVVDQAYSVLEGGDSLPKTVSEGVRSKAEARLKVEVEKATQLLEQGQTLGPEVKIGVSTRANAAFNDQVGRAEAQMEAGTWKEGTGPSAVEKRARTNFDSRVNETTDAYNRTGVLPANGQAGLEDAVMRKDVADAYAKLKSGDPLGDALPQAVRDQAQAQFNREVDSAYKVLEDGGQLSAKDVGNGVKQQAESRLKDAIEKARKTLEEDGQLDPAVKPGVRGPATTGFNEKIARAEAEMERGEYVKGASPTGVEKGAQTLFDQQIEKTTTALYRDGVLPEGTLRGVSDTVMRNEVGKAFEIAKQTGTIDAKLPQAIKDAVQTRFDRVVENAYKTLEANETLSATVGDGVKRAAEARIQQAVDAARGVLENNGTLGPEVKGAVRERATAQFNQEISGIEAKMEGGTYQPHTGSPGAEGQAQKIFEDKVRLATDALRRDGVLPGNIGKGIGDTVMDREVSSAYQTLQTTGKLDASVPQIIRDPATTLFKADVNNAYKVLEADGTVDAKAVGEGVASQAEARLKDAVSQARKTLEEGGKLDENVKPGVARRATEGFDQKVEETAARMEEPGYVPGSSAPGVERDARAIYDRKVKETTEAFYKDGTFPSTTSKGIEQAVMRNEVDNAFETLKAGKTVDGAVPQVVRDVAQERFDRVVDQAYSVLEGGGTLPKTISEGVSTKAEARLKDTIQRATAELENGDKLEASTPPFIRAQAEAAIKDAVTKAQGVLENGETLDRAVTAPEVAKQALEGFNKKVVGVQADMENGTYVAKSSAPGVEAQAQAGFDKTVRDATEAFKRDGVFQDGTAKYVQDTIVRKEVNDAYDIAKETGVLSNKLPEVVREKVEARLNNAIDRTYKTLDGGGELDASTPKFVGDQAQAKFDKSITDATAKLERGDSVAGVSPTVQAKAQARFAEKINNAEAAMENGTYATGSSSPIVEAKAKAVFDAKVDHVVAEFDRTGVVPDGTLKGVEARAKAVVRGYDHDALVAMEGGSEAPAGMLPGATARAAAEMRQDVQNAYDVLKGGTKALDESVPSAVRTQAEARFARDVQIAKDTLEGGGRLAESTPVGIRAQAEAAFNKEVQEARTLLEQGKEIPAGTTSVGARLEATAQFNAKVDKALASLEKSEALPETLEPGVKARAQAQFDQKVNDAAAALERGEAEKVAKDFSPAVREKAEARFNEKVNGAAKEIEDGKFVPGSTSEAVEQRARQVVADRLAAAEKEAAAKRAAELAAAERAGTPVVAPRVLAGGGVVGTERAIEGDQRKQEALVSAPVTAAQVMPTDQLIKLGEVRRGEGFFQSADRILRANGHKPSMDEIRALTAAFQQMWTAEHGQDTRKLKVNHHLMTGENLADVLSRLNDPKLTDSRGHRFDAQALKKIDAQIRALTVDTTKKAS